MPIVFTYGATTVTLQTGPDMGDFTVKKSWLSPEITAAGGEDTFVYDKENVPLFHVLDVRKMKEADALSLLAFLILVDGISAPWAYTDPEGVAWSARFWNAQEISTSLIRHGRESVQITLLITPPA